MTSASEWVKKLGEARNPRPNVPAGAARAEMSRFQTADITYAVQAANHYGMLVDALEARQSHMCCYPPEPCDRCRADAALLATVAEAAQKALARPVPANG